MDCPPPGALQVEITSTCNLTCRMCPLTLGATMSSRDPGHMTEATWSEVVVAARAIGRVNLTGYGENAMHPRFGAMLRELDDGGVRLSFTTNGIPMHARLVADLARLRHLDQVNVSIDSPDPEVYRRIRGGDVTRALDGLKRLTRALRPRTWITASSVVMDTNVDSLLEFPPLLKRLGVDTWVLQGLHDRTAALLDRDIRRHPDGLATVARIQERCRDVGLPVTVHADDTRFLPVVAGEVPPFSPERTRQCIAPWSTPYVDRAGRVFPCCIAADGAVMGRLDEAPLDEIWRGARYAAFRTALVEGTNLPSVCRACTAVTRVGPHPRRFAGRIEQADLSGRVLRIVARNTGRDAWTRHWPLAIGLVGDGVSALRLPSWAAHDRIQYMRDDEVRPGGSTRFDFRIAHAAPGVCETFALVVESVTWLDDTRFTLPAPRPRRRLAQRLAAIVRR